MTEPSRDPRPLTDNERALIDGFLIHDFPGVEELREQAQHVMAERGCECGCGSIGFVSDGTPLPPSMATSPVPVDGHVVVDREAAGGLILSLDKGALSFLEVSSYVDLLPLPVVDQVTWESRP